MQNKTKFRVLVIDDEPEVIRSFQLALAEQWDIVGMSDPRELDRDIRENVRALGGFDLIFLDLLFDRNKTITAENVGEVLDQGDLLGVRALDWIQENYAHPIVILSGNLFSQVAAKVRENHPHLLMKSKPVDLYASDFRDTMEWYARNYFRLKMKAYMDPLLQSKANVDRLMGKKP